MEICQIGVIEFLLHDKITESKAIGGISGYVNDLLDYLLDNNISTIFVGKIYNYQERKNLTYLEVQHELSSTNRFLINLFFKSLFIRVEKKTIIHAHRPDNLAAFALFKRNPTIVTLHGQQALTVFKRKGFIIRCIYKSLEIIALRKAVFLIATDEITKNYYCSVHPKLSKKIRVVPTGIDTDKFKPLDVKDCRRKFGFAENDIIIIYIGRIEAPKKVADIINAYKLVKEHISLLKLILVGSGNQLGEMKQLVEELELKDTIYFLGARMRQELPEIINCADISVLYSGNEGSPLSVKESLACGIPVVANKVGDVDTVLQNGINGFIVEVNNIESLAISMEKCLRIAYSMKERCVGSCYEFTNKKVYQKILGIYNELSNCI
jgi:L-malate glycosyltransferase